MIRNTLTFIIFFISIGLQAQTPVFTGFTFLFGVHIEGDNLYFCDANALYKSNLTQTPLTYTTVYNNYLETLGFDVYNNYLYGASEGADEIYKIDLSTGIRTTVLSGLSNPEGVVIIGDHLYYSSVLDSKIYAIDLTAATPSPIPIVDGLAGGAGMYNVGTTIYVADLYGNGIYSFNTADTLPSLTLEVTETSIVDLIVIGNYVYYINLSNATLSRADLTGNTPNTVLLSGLGYPVSLDAHGNQLYISDGNTTLYTYTLPSLNTEDVALNKLYLYPNPTSEYIQLNNLKEATDFSIYDMLGKKVLKGTMLADTPFQISALENGSYFLKTIDGQTFKFIKNR